MKKTALLSLLYICYCSISFGQDFSFDELVKLRSFSYPKFETYVHDKGYALDHLEYSETCTIFTNKNNIISYCKFGGGELSYNNHTVIKFETSDKDQYEKIKQEAEQSLDYYTTKLHRYRNEHYIEHIYDNDIVSVHLYDIAYRYDKNPYYAIEIYSIYSGY